jgi:hypothetical protein
MPKCVGLETSALDPLEFACALICVWSITLPVSIDMLQIHPYAQLAHWSVVTLTTVENRCEKWFFFSNHLNKTIKSLSLLYPIHVTIESWISHDWSHHHYILTLPPHQTGLISNNTYYDTTHAGGHPCVRIIRSHNTLILYRHINIVVSQLVTLTQCTQPLQRRSGQHLSQNIY